MNRTLVELLEQCKPPLSSFVLLAEAIATACFTQNLSLVIPRHEKTPYHIINARKPSVKFFHIFGSLCYIVKDGENLDKMKEKGDAYYISSDLGPQCSTTVLEQDSLSPGPQSQENVPQVAETVTTLRCTWLLIIPDKRQQHNITHTSTTTDVADRPPLNIHSTHQTPTQVPTVTAPENITQAETNRKDAQFTMMTIYRTILSVHRITKNEGRHRLVMLIRQTCILLSTRPSAQHKVLTVSRSVNGLKQAPRVWDDELSNFLDCTSMSSAEAEYVSLSAAAHKFYG
ncbi:hypothetical protein Tco_0413079 [Tanacetum coccineum]